ncbi:HAMP domain-containing histidine kinase [Treponema sp. OMZ 799]|uniref:sensor histidine kinase n=1 Tax=Treponema sp. OMZ 799 TaxID=2563668 RepID=UPI0020A3D29C|nr:HAMP domain-containing sensor histidine kinase [Treponema sp. OMZ 799]UTC76822.1 HAMP domain-containing histidine kinase [Treponema sp. OMZ 799]
MKKFYTKTGVCFLLIILLCVNSFIIFIYKINEINFYLSLAQIIGAADNFDKSDNPDKSIEKMLLSSLKNKNRSQEEKGKDILKKHGYIKDFFIFKNKVYDLVLLCSLASITTAALFLVYNRHKNKQLNKRIASILSVAEKIQEGDYKFYKEKEDEFSLLEDSIYKSLIILRETRLAALTDKEEYKENLENIAHQLKIPITSINLMLELLEDNATDNNILESEAFQKIKKQISRLENLTEVLLKLARLDSGSIEMKKEVFLLEECLIHSMESIEDDLKIKGLLPKLNLNGIKISGDFYWLSEAFLNIVKNFSDFYPKVKNISISAKENAVYTQVSFENDGPKIPASDLKNIFRRFYKSNTNEGKGFGIGLAMSQTILKKHNAEIRAENTKSGTAFIVKFYKESTTIHTNKPSVKSNFR